MARKPVEVELEAIYKLQIKQVQKKLDHLNLLENETFETNEISADLDIYIRQRELRAYITNYRIALSQLKRYGKYYTGHPVEKSWLNGLTTVQRTVFIARFSESKSFEEIAIKLKIAFPQKVYESAYKKVVLNIQQSIL